MSLIYASFSEKNKRRNELNTDTPETLRAPEPLPTPQKPEQPKPEPLANEIDSGPTPPSQNEIRPGPVVRETDSAQMKRINNKAETYLKEYFGPEQFNRRLIHQAILGASVLAIGIGAIGVSVAGAIGTGVTVEAPPVSAGMAIISMNAFRGGIMSVASGSGLLVSALQGKELKFPIMLDAIF